MTDALAPASQEHAPLVKHETDVGAFFFIENEEDEMRCVFCSNEMRHVLAGNGDPCFFCDHCDDADNAPRQKWGIGDVIIDETNSIEMTTLDDWCT